MFFESVAPTPRKKKKNRNHIDYDAPLICNDAARGKLASSAKIYRRFLARRAQFDVGGSVRYAATDSQTKFILSVERRLIVVANLYEIDPPFRRAIFAVRFSERRFNKQYRENIGENLPCVDYSCFFFFFPSAHLRLFVVRSAADLSSRLASADPTTDWILFFSQRLP